MLCDGGNLTAFLTPRPRPSADWPRDVGTQTRPPPLPRRQCLWVAVGVESRPPRGGKLRRAGGHRFARNGELRRHSLHCCQGSASATARGQQDIARTSRLTEATRCQTEISQERQRRESLFTPLLPHTFTTGWYQFWLIQYLNASYVNWTMV